MKLVDEELREIKRKLLYIYLGGKIVHYVTMNEDRIEGIIIAISVCDITAVIRESSAFLNGCLDNLLLINTALFM